MTNDIELLTHEEVRRLFHYDKDTGIVTRNVYTSSRSKIGDVVGSFDKYHGYLRVNINHKSYRIHRIIFLWMNGDFPKHQVDHINQIRTDNRWVNLREVTHKDNLRNLSLRGTNTSGFNGVNWNKATSKWLSYIRVDGKLIRLGLYESIIDAVAARISANTKYGFHPNHGAKHFY